MAKPPADVFHLACALIVVTSVIAMGEIVRALRYLTVPLALGLIPVP